jgi:hypothetical protein
MEATFMGAELTLTLALLVALYRRRGCSHVALGPPDDLGRPQNGDSHG